MSRLLCQTPAKINLGLEILGKRNDGYHEIHTLFLPVTLFDTLSVGEADDFYVECVPSLDIPQEENIVVKAARFFQRSASVQKGAHFLLEKHIPQGAGLGGGSSDAAAAICLLNELWQTKLNNEQLCNIAAAIGSDAPFFISKVPAIGQGRGEKLMPADIQLDCGIVIVYPQVAVSTAWAYKEAIPSKFINSSVDFEEIIHSISMREWREYIRNDFEYGVFKRFPQIAQAKKSLYDAGADFALMSGSGSCVFGLFADDAQAQRVAAQFANGYFCKQFTAHNAN